ncbi:hypothetical protein [Modestobacter lapidis]|nr:hypothetical protein [Modestobacter lapidis]
MSPLRGDVLITGFVLAIPVLLLGLRGDLAPDDVVLRVVWCLGAGWAAVALMRFATVPRTPARSTTSTRTPPASEPPTS